LVHVPITFFQTLVDEEGGGGDELLGKGDTAGKEAIWKE
jgi:hypothetical protein